MKYFIFLAWYIISINFVPQTYFQASDLLIIAHRGGVKNGIPENTLQAYQQCIASDFYAIEVDLRATKDNQIVLLHDDRVDRTTNGQGLVSSFSLTELQRLDAGQGNHVPTLVETLDLIKNTKTK